MQTIEQSLSELVIAGRVTQEEAMAKAPDKDAFFRFLREGGRPDDGGMKPMEVTSAPPSMNIMGLGRYQR
jgi:hypothetical protein